MAKTRRVINQVDRSHGTSFDDQMWPVNLALLVLAGFTAGIILVKSDFSSPSILSNGWVRLLGLGITTLGMLLLAHVLNNHRLARRLQLAVLVSVLVHLGLTLFLSEAYMKHIAQQQAETGRVIEIEDLPVLPEYIFTDPDEIPEQEFEKPVETASPEKPTELPEREPTEEKVSEAQPQPVRLPEPEPEVKPSPVKMPRQQVSTPRRADETSRLSKQAEVARTQPNASIAMPSQKLPTNSKPAPNPSPEASPVERATADANVPRQQQPREVESPQSKQAVKVANRANTPRQQAAVSSTATLPKQIAKAAETPRADAPREVAARPQQQQQPKAPSPQATVDAKAVAASPQKTAEPTEQSPDPPTPVKQADAPRQQQAERQPTIAAARQVSPNRQRVETSIASEAPIAPNQTASKQPTPNATPAPQQNQVAKQANQTEAKIETPAEASTATPRAVASAVNPRVQSSAVPTLAPEQQATARPQRAAAEANVAQAQATDAERPSAATTANQQTPSPQSTEVAKAETTPSMTSQQTNAPSSAPSEITAQTASPSRSQPAPAQPTVTPTESNAPSRQATPTAVAAASATEAPASVNSPTNTTAAATPQPTAGEVARQTAAVPNRSPSANPTTSTPGQVQTNTSSPAVARSSNPAKAPSISPSATAANTPRRAAEASQVAATPLSQPATAGAANAATSTAKSPSPSATAVAKTQTGAPQVRPTADAPTLSSSTEATASNPGRRQASANDQPSLASSDAPTPTRQTVDTSLSSTQAAEAPTSAAANQTAANSSPAPQADATPRATAQVSSPTTSDTAATNVPQLETAPATSQSLARNAQSAAAPSLTPSASPTEQPRRTQEVAAATGSPSPLESPAVEVAASDASPTAKPSSSALNRAEVGVVGAGASPNADIQSAATPQNTAPVAAAAAQRATPVQQDAGPSLSPSKPATIAKSRAGADTPTALFEAQEVAAADTTGAKETSQLAASASAAVQKSAASAPLSNMTAAAGKLEVDTGTTQIVPEAGTGRAAGGGQPRIALNAQNEKVARARAGGAPVSSIASDVQQPTPTAPKENGGGSPPGPQVNLTAKAADRSGGAPLPKVGEPASAPTAASAGKSEQVAAAQLARASAGGSTGGQPELGATPPGEKLEKVTTGTPALATLASDIANPTATAPMANGGGSPPGPAPSAVAEAARADSGAPKMTKAGQPAPSGAETAAGGKAEQVAASTLARAEAGQAGGAPQVNGSEQKIAKSVASGAPMSSLAAAVAPTTAAPVGDGGGSPLGPVAATAETAAGERLTVPMGATLAQNSVAPPAASGGTAGEVASSSITRAASAETLPGVNAGGGTETPAKNRGMAAALLTQAAVPQMEANPAEGSAAKGQPLSSQGTEIARASSGLPGKLETGPTGAVESVAAFESNIGGTPGIGSRVAEAARGSASAPTLGESGESSAPVRKGTMAALPSGMAANAEQLAMASTATDIGSSGTPTAGPDLGEDAPSRIPGAVPVRVQAETGVGGLGPRPALDVGIPSRHAQRDSTIAKIEPGKFMLKKEGGSAAISGMAKDIAPAFAKRGDRQMDKENGGAGQPSAKTEAAIESGVDFLSRHQMEDGRWSFHLYGVGKPGFEAETASIQADTAATGLALLAFLGAGYDHLDDKHQQRVAAGLDYLVRNQQANGDLYLPQHEGTNQVAALYSHGIASIALCEAYGMTGDPELKKAAQKAIDFIVDSQHKDRGGWRYTPNYSSDLSVSGWQLMAMKSGELSGLNVPPETYEKVVKFLDRCSVEEGAFYVYNPYAGNSPTVRHGREPSTVMTGVGLLMRQYTGWDREHPAMKRGADHLLANLPTNGTSSTPALTGTIKNPYRDTYYWYYATQFMFHMKGKYWKEWNERLHPLLTDSQIATGTMAGSWDPMKPIPDKWGPQGGRIYITAMNILSLEVYYRHLPIYENTAK